MPTQSPPSQNDLVRVLEAATEQGKLNWKTTAEENTFRATFDLGMVRISKEFGDFPYSLTLLDSDGIVLDEFEPAALSNESEQLESLYKKVRSRVLQLESKLITVYDKLKQLAGES